MPSCSRHELGGDPSALAPAAAVRHSPAAQLAGRGAARRPGERVDVYDDGGWWQGEALDEPAPPGRLAVRLVDGARTAALADVRATLAWAPDARGAGGAWRAAGDAGAQRRPRCTAVAPRPAAALAGGASAPDASGAARAAVNGPAARPREQRPPASGAGAKRGSIGAAGRASPAKRARHAAPPPAGPALGAGRGAAGRAADPSPSAPPAAGARRDEPRWRAAVELLARGAARGDGAQRAAGISDSSPSSSPRGAPRARDESDSEPEAAASAPSSSGTVSGGAGAGFGGLREPAAGGVARAGGRGRPRAARLGAPRPRSSAGAAGRAPAPAPADGERRRARADGAVTSRAIEAYQAGRRGLLPVSRASCTGTRMQTHKDVDLQIGRMLPARGCKCADTAHGNDRLALAARPLGAGLEKSGAAAWPAGRHAAGAARQVPADFDGAAALGAARLDTPQDAEASLPAAFLLRFLELRAQARRAALPPPALAPPAGAKQHAGPHCGRLS